MTHFVIIAQIRSGYQHFANMLHSHPDILCLGEIFVLPQLIRVRSLFGADVPAYEGGDQVRYIQDVLVPYASQHNRQALGFKLNYTSRELWPYVQEQQWQVIHLVRRNLLDRLLSEKLAITEGKWNFREYTQQVPIKLEELVAYTEDSYRHQRDTDEAFPCALKIFYEDMISQPTLMNRVLAYLDVKDWTLSSTMIKQRVGPQHKYISNYRELSRDILRRKPEYRRFLTDIPIV